MKVRFLLFLCSAFFILGCSNDEDSDKEFYTFSNNSQIVLIELQEDHYLANIDDGDNLVFKYRFTEDDDPDIADDEYSEQIIFEIDNSLTSFNYSSENLDESKMYFNQFCFCPNINSVHVTTGTLEGEQISSSKWRVSIDVEFLLHDQLVERHIEGVFESD